ncbi:MAG: putative secreted protein [Paenibacillus sp.]|nr:putative secreted protein [Paenibacillus sp.]
MTKGQPAIWSIRPLAINKASNNDWTQRISASLHKWVQFTETQFQIWPDQPRCGHFFGGAYWYGFESGHTAAVYAVLATFDEPGVETNYSQEHLADRAISAIRYLGFTHDTGPDECVRVIGKDPRCSGNKWGGLNDSYFMATQVGGTISYLGLAAWLLWDRLDDETRIMMQNTISSYANRWSEVEPRNGTYIDTQLEENAWTGIGIFTAALMFPEHPNNDKWWKAYHKWNINTTTTFRDRLSNELSRGVPLRSRVTAITLHPDYTTENHAFVHPTYMAASMHFRGREIADLLLAGMPVDSMDTHNDKAMYEHTLKQWTEADGIPTSVQGQDWWYNQQHGFMHAHALMNVLHQDGEAAKLEAMALSTIERLQNSNTRGCYLEQEGEHCHIMPQDHQTAIDMEHMSASHVLNTYLIHKLGGAGAEPVDKQQLDERLAGVREYPYGGFVIHRTEATFTSFSWRNHVMALSQPKHGGWMHAPLYDSYTGNVQIHRVDAGHTPFNEAFVIEAKEHYLDVRDDGFAAYAMLERGNEHLLQHVGFVSLPDGRSVYWEQFEALASVTITKLETGSIGLRNEFYSELLDWAKGFRKLHLPTTTERFDSWRPHSSDKVRDYPACRYVNIDNEVGYLLYGSNGIRYHNQHVYPKWKGGEDRLILNRRDVPVTLSASERTSLFAIVNLPNFTVAQTVELADQGRFYSGAERNGNGTEDSSSSPTADGVLSSAALWKDGSYLVYFNCGEHSEIVSFTELLDGTNVSLFPGSNRINNSSHTWSVTVPSGRSGYYSSIGTIDFAAGTTEEAELDISVNEETVIFMNTGKQHVSITFTRSGNDVRKERIELPPGAFFQQR